nr:sensor histidine kinase [uncultured Allomuricauda sp.]
MWIRIIKTSLALYIPLLIFTIFWSHLQKQSLIYNMAHIQQKNILNKSFHLADECTALTEITSYWSTVPFPPSFSDTSELEEGFIENYIKILQGVDEYDQFRLIDTNGQEILRYEKTGTNKMLPAQVQNKVNRPYFNKGLTLKKGQVYISPIELNQEYGEIEIPYKPVMRGVTPIFDNNDDQVGLAVVNFDLTKIFDLMKARISDDNFFLVDKDRNVIATNLSSNYLPHQALMSHQDSLIREKLLFDNMSLEKDTFFMKEGNLWVFQNVNVGFENKGGKPTFSNVADVVSNNNWAIIQQIPAAYISKMLQSIRRNLLLFNILTLFVILLIALGYARTQKERNSFIESLKAKKEELQRNREQLEHTNQLVQKSNRRLQVRNQQLEDFNYVVAHNLKSPVTSMSIIVDMLSKSSDLKTFNELFPKLKTISNNISTLTEDVQSYVSILNNNELEIENVNLLVLLEDVENDFVETLMDKKARNFQTIYRFNAWYSLKCSKFYMKSILQNFLSNAIKYRRTDVDSYVIFETAYEKGKKILYIKDNGLGIDLERHGQNMFKLYKRFHRNISGKGMGLFIVKSQLEAMNASLEVESEAGVGTTFKMKFN